VRQDEACEAHGLVVVERRGRFGAAGLVPDAEANMSLGVATAEVARDAERAPVLALDDFVRPEELDDLAPLRRGAPGAVVKPCLDGSAALRALAYPSLLSNGGY
jgi:hypothetical protein